MVGARGEAQGEALTLGRVLSHRLGRPILDVELHVLLDWLSGVDRDAATDEVCVGGPAGDADHDGVRVEPDPVVRREATLQQLPLPRAGWGEDSETLRRDEEGVQEDCWAWRRELHGVQGAPDGPGCAVQWGGGMTPIGVFSACAGWGGDPSRRISASGGSGGHPR